MAFVAVKMSDMGGKCPPHTKVFGYNGGFFWSSFEEKTPNCHRIRSERYDAPFPPLTQTRTEKCEEDQGARRGHGAAQELQADGAVQHDVPRQARHAAQH